MNTTTTKTIMAAKKIERSNLRVPKKHLRVFKHLANVAPGRSPRLIDIRPGYEADRWEKSIREIEWVGS